MKLLYIAGSMALGIVSRHQDANRRDSGYRSRGGRTASPGARPGGDSLGDGPDDNRKVWSHGNQHTPLVIGMLQTFFVVSATAEFACPYSLIAYRKWVGRDGESDRC